MGVSVPRFDEALRTARDAEAAHLEAVMRQADARVLRLAGLKDKIAAGLGGHARDLKFLELKAIEGNEPLLWLDLVHVVSMQPDNGTYRLEAQGQQGREVLAETGNSDEMTRLCLRHMAHEVVKTARQAPPVDPAGSDSQISGWSAVTLLYVWLTGFVVGVAVLALLAIYMKNIIF